MNEYFEHHQFVNEDKKAVVHQLDRYIKVSAKHKLNELNEKAIRTKITTVELEDYAAKYADFGSYDTYSRVGTKVDLLYGKAIYIDSVYLREAMMRLSVEDRTIMVMADVHQYTYEEISNCIGRPVSTVQYHHKRAINTMHCYIVARGGTIDG